MVEATDATGFTELGKAAQFGPEVSNPDESSPVRHIPADYDPEHKLTLTFSLLTPDPMNAPLTEGSRRVMELAATLAHTTRFSEVLAEHLLWAIWLDQSRGAEILADRGFSQDRLAQHLPLPEWWSEDASPTNSATDNPVAPPHSPTLVEIVAAARDHVGNLGRQVEIGTEHLLLALTQVPSSVSPILSELQLGTETVLQQVVAQTGDCQGPLDPGVRLEPAREPQTDQSDLFRILDAASNRVREGLRVIEDYVRFALNDRHLTERLKECRHQFAQTERLLAPALRLAARDTPGDIGTSLHTGREMRRQSLTDVVQADFKRVQEACRTLEEYGKTLSAEFSQAAGQTRYACYTLERAVLQTACALDRLAERRLYLLLTEALCPHGSGPVLRAALSAGVGIVQVREKSMTDRQLLAHARRVRDWTADADCLLIINDRPDIAALVGADGVHVGQDELPVAEARRIVGPDKLVGVSTHSLEQARAAVLDGADYIGIGPVFPTHTKHFSPEELAGLNYVTQATSETALPGFCIGGIGLDNLHRVVAAGGRRIAVSGAICSAEDPAAVTAELASQLAAANSPRE
jgi:thiamine-phosphate pyrophosphorylase